MGRSGLRALFSGVMTVALVVTASGASSAGQDGACEGWTPEIPRPPFDEHTIVVRFDWPGTEKYAQHYYVVPAGASLDDYPSLDDSEKARHTGGCSPDLHDPTNAHSGCRRIDPLILTEASLDEWYQRDKVPIPHDTHVLVPGSYTLVARPGFICRFADDLGVKSSYERYGEDLAAAPDAVKLTATIEYYEGGAPEPHHSRKRRGLVPLGDKLSPDQELAVWQAIGEPIVLPEASEEDPWAGEETAALPPQDSSEETSAGETGEERRWRATVMLAVLVFGGPRLFLAAALTGDWERALEILELSGVAEDSPEAVDHPTKSPPEMSDEASKQGRQWVWLPTEAPVRKKGATHWLKPGAWYQTKVDKDGNRTFYGMKGKLIGRTPDKVQVKVWGNEAEVPDQDAAGVMRTMLTDATTGQVHQQPASPPPTARPEHAQHWVYVPLPTRTYHQDRAGLTGYNYSREAHVLMPGRWYQGTYRASKKRWWIYTTDGQFLGAEPDEDFVRVSPTTPLPEDESR